MAGREEGAKHRPSVIILCSRNERDETMVTVLPITHSKPRNTNQGVELPTAVKSHLGLDEQKSWVIVSEGNEFVWPGYDLRSIPGSGSFVHGFLPPRLFEQIKSRFLEHHAQGQARKTSRT